MARVRTALVTGGNGYVASWIVQQLLWSGIDVRATVRDRKDRAKTRHLRSIAYDTPGALSLFSANLLDPEGFDRAMTGCDVVLHTASPLRVRGVRDPVRELIEPATAGTRNVLMAVNRTPTVNRVVLTSSIAAIYGDAADLAATGNGCFTEEHWNETSSERHQPYAYSKTLAERLAWKLAEEQDRWDLVAVNPGLVFGPALSPHTSSESVQIMRDFGTGFYRLGAASFEFAIADVRDVAEAHLQAAISPSASGRYIVVSETMTLLQIAHVLRSRYGDEFPFPRRTLPKMIVSLLAPLRGLPRRVINRNVGYPLKFDNRRAKCDLGIGFRPAAEAVVDHFGQLLKDDLVPSPTGMTRRIRRAAEVR